MHTEGRRAQEPARQCWGFRPEAPGTREGTVVESEGLDLQALTTPSPDVSASPSGEALVQLLF